MSPEEQKNEILLRGIVKRITYENSATGFVVCRIVTDDSLEEVTLTGKNLILNTGENIIAKGYYSRHEKFGYQFNARSVEHILPTSPKGLINYLGGGIVKGIGPKTAAKIVKHFGDDIINVLQNDPQRLTEVAGINHKKALELSELFSSRNERGEIDRFFSEYEIPKSLVDKIYQRFGINSIEVVKQNPYALAFHIRGIGFITADSIALKLGLSKTSPQRLQSGIFYALEKAKDDGHCFLQYDDLVLRTNALLNIDSDNQVKNLQPYIKQLTDAGYVVIEDNRIYLKSLYDVECSVAEFLASRTKPFEHPLINDSSLENIIKKTEADLGITLSSEQRDGVYAASRYPLLAVTGGPGCGKTTVIKAISRLFIEANKHLALAAPTGKAAQRMSQVSGLPASTIHRLLGYDPIKNQFRYGPNAPLAIGDNERSDLVDAVIIDEASMIDISLAESLFSSIPYHATVILVGDKDQLPSVGPGRLFADILSCPEIKHVTLTHLYRRGEESRITTIAHDINSGTVPEIPKLGTGVSDAYFVELNEPEEIINYTLHLTTKQIPKYRGLSPKDISILTPSNVGPLGTIELNKRLQKAINPNRKLGKFITVGDKEFRVGDKVCQRVNNYKIDPDGVFNGDSGIIREVDSVEKSLVVELWDGRYVKYQNQNLDQLSLAYAITVHRSQGSELPCVIMILHDSQYILLERQLIYTGITRAKGLLFIIGTKRAVKIATQKTSVNHRQTALKEKFNSYLINFNEQ